MPSRTNSVSKPQTATVPGKRFELPALEFKFGSLTEGTDIPPPLPSPIEPSVPTPPETPKDGKLTAANGKTDATSPKSTGSNPTAGTKRPAEDNPSSPTLSSRPGSIRRLFSRNLLNNAYANGEENGTDGEHARPASRSAASIADPKNAKRSSGWFSRFRSNDSSTKRASTPLSPTSPTEDRKPMGPPPPMIPELNELKSKIDHEQDLSFGNDLFKNIK
ncbi:hypothetical protein V8F33_008387 [Rhypophila sp. PSN 637]